MCLVDPLLTCPKCSAKSDIPGVMVSVINSGHYEREISRAEVWAAVQAGIDKGRIRYGAT